jgi:DNA polymerase III subunit delta'
MSNLITTHLFSQVIGQSSAIELLTQAIVQHHVAPAYLFAGANGIGKRLAANCFVQALLGDVSHRAQRGNHPDLLWVEPTYLHQNKRYSPAEAEAAGVKRKSAPIVRLDQIREISTFLSRPPLESDRSVVVIDQAETMPESAANALLKTLEEPGRATIILIAPSPESLLPTLVSRSQRIPFYRLSQIDLSEVLRRSDKAEILEHPQIIDLAQGSPGDAIEQWQKLQDIPPELLSQAIQRPTTIPDALRLAKQITKSLDPESQIWLLDYLQQVYWRSGQVEISVLQQLEKSKEYLRAYVQPQLVWEVTLMSSLIPA